MKFGKLFQRRYRDGQKVWFLHPRYGWWPGEIVRPADPGRAEYRVAVEGDPLRTRYVAAGDLRSW